MDQASRPRGFNQEVAGGENLLKPDGREVRSNPAVDVAPAAAGGPPRPEATPDAERALVERARARDTEAFRVLVEQHRDRAYGLALRMIRSAPDAEEVAQDAFVRAWLGLPRFRFESSFSTWLYRIVARRAIDRIATLTTRRRRESALDAAGEQLAADPGSGVEQHSRSRRLETLVAALPETQRAVVTLFYFEDCSVERVAQVLGLPTGTVKTHLSRARAALRQAWIRIEERSHDLP